MTLGFAAIDSYLWKYRQMSVLTRIQLYVAVEMSELQSRDDDDEDDDDVDETY